MNEGVCSEHSGIVSNIESLRACTNNQRHELEDVRTKTDRMMSRLNTILGGIVVSIFVLLIDIILRIAGR